jgi:hypothetical protein
MLVRKIEKGSFITIRQSKWNLVNGEGHAVEVKETPPRDPATQCRQVVDLGTPTIGAVLYVIY